VTGPQTVIFSGGSAASFPGERTVPRANHTAAFKAAGVKPLFSG